MNASPKCAALIKQFEGCRLKAYLCPAGVPTIGWGATGPDIKLGLTWTQAQADDRLAKDIARFATGVTALLGGRPTTQGQFDALVDFAFNLGTGALGKSTLLTLHKSGEFKAAADQFARWVNANGKPLPGLVRRRAAEMELYLS